MRHSKPTLEYLTTCSETSLEAFELSRYNRVANLRKQLRALVEEWIEAEVDARVARWIRDQKQGELSKQAASPVSVPSFSRLSLGDVVSHAVLTRVTRPPYHSPFEPFRISFRATANLTVAAFCRSADNFARLSQRALTFPARASRYPCSARSVAQLRLLPRHSRLAAHIAAFFANTLQLRQSITRHLGSMDNTGEIRRIVSGAPILLDLHDRLPLAHIPSHFQSSFPPARIRQPIC